MSKKPILITGVAGFIGSQVAAALLANGHEVVGVDDLSSGNPQNIPEGVDFIQADLSSRAVVPSLMREWTAILHLAGQSSGELSFDNPVDDLQKNTVTTLRLAEVAAASSCRMIFASSMAVYSDTSIRPLQEAGEVAPKTCYGVSKLASEKYLKVLLAPGQSTSLRMFNVYGPGQELGSTKQGMVRIFLNQALRNGEIVVRGSRDRVRDFVYIDDVVNVWSRLAEAQDQLPGVVNLGTGQATKVGALVAAISEQFDSISVTYESGTRGDQGAVVADTTLLRATLGSFGFTRLKNGISNTVNWIESQYGTRKLDN